MDHILNQQLLNNNNTNNNTVTSTPADVNNNQETGDVLPNKTADTALKYINPFFYYPASWIKNGFGGSSQNNQNNNTSLPFVQPQISNDPGQFPIVNRLQMPQNQPLLNQSILPYNQNNQLLNGFAQGINNNTINRFGQLNTNLQNLGQFNAQSNDFNTDQRQLYSNQLQSVLANYLANNFSGSDDWATALQKKSNRGILSNVANILNQNVENTSRIGQQDLDSQNSLNQRDLSDMRLSDINLANLGLKQDENNVNNLSKYYNDAITNNQNNFANQVSLQNANQQNINSNITNTDNTIKTNQTIDSMNASNRIMNLQDLNNKGIVNNETNTIIQNNLPQIDSVRKSILNSPVVKGMTPEQANSYASTEAVRSVINNYLQQNQVQRAQVKITATPGQQPSYETTVPLAMGTKINNLINQQSEQYDKENKDKKDNNTYVSSTPGSLQK